MTQQVTSRNLFYRNKKTNMEKYLRTYNRAVFEIANIWKKQNYPSEECPHKFRYIYTRRNKYICTSHDNIIWRKREREREREMGRGWRAEEREIYMAST